MLEKQSLSKLHDAEIAAIRIDRPGRRLLIEFRCESSEIVRLEFCDVAAFRLNDLIFQNVVSRLITSSSQTLGDAEIRGWVTWANSLSETQVLITNEAVEKYVKQITNKEITLFILEPSWGAEGVVICKSIADQRTGNAGKVITP